MYEILIDIDMYFLLFEKGLDFSDSEDMLGGKSSSTTSPALVPKTSNLKSSIKVRSQSWLKLSILLEKIASQLVHMDIKYFRI